MKEVGRRKSTAFSILVGRLGGKIKMIAGVSMVNGKGFVSKQLLGQRSRMCDLGCSPRTAKKSEIQE